MSSSSRPTSTGSTSMLLPEIRTMSPFKAIPTHKQPSSDAAFTASSVTSHDSFMTAFTSTPSPSPSSPSTSRLTVASPHSLRKSVSVDSFINARRSPDLSEAGPSSGSQTRDYSRDAFPSEHRVPVHSDAAYSAAHPGANGRSPHSPISRNLPSRILGRARGHSLSGPSAAEYDDPYLDDSDHERASDLAHLSSLSSRNPHPPSGPLNGLKGKARARPDDALLLPPRAPVLSAASSMSSINSASSTSGVPTIVPPSLPHPSRRPVPGTLTLSPQRSRSGSLGTNPTRSSGENLAHGEKTVFTIAVVGAPGCGKSTFIKKGLKVWAVGEETIKHASTPYGQIRYSIRTINAARADEVNAHVLEVNSDSLQLDMPDGAWPEGLPAIDGVQVLYDASNPASFTRVPDLLAGFHKLRMPAIVIACKSDLEKKVRPHYSLDRASSFDMGLVEVSHTDKGKVKMRQCFHFIIKSIERVKQPGEMPSGVAYLNPASPDYINAPWSDGYPDSSRVVNRSRTGTPSANSPSASSRFPPHIHSSRASPSPTGASTPTPRTPSLPTSPTRVKSTNDLMTEVERSRQEERQRDSPDGRSGSLPRSTSLSRLRDGNNEAQTSEFPERGPSGESKDGGIRKNDDPPPMPWATLEELLDKLFFVAASGDDPTFIKHFFLTYRKFATPRRVLLGMQKRIRQLSHEHSDLLLGSYAQMRICDLLEEWIATYPNDFATPGADGAMKALVKQISSNPSTLHYGSDIYPFLDDLHHLQDLDASWSMPCEDISRDSEDEGLEEEEDVSIPEPSINESSIRHSVVPSTVVTDSSTAVNTILDSPSMLAKSTTSSNGTRDRKGSLPLSAKSILSTQLSIPLSTSSESSRSYSRGISGLPRPGNSPKELVKLASTLSTYDPVEIAEQITKMQSELFLRIEPRQWLRYAMGDVKSDPTEPISANAAFYNQLAYWVSSLIVAHERVKLREKQVERFVELARALRTMNNYVGLRAVMTGINNATFPNDEIMTMFRDSKLRLYQQYLGYGVLINSQNNHRSYRIALRHTNGPAVPDMEVHTFDIVRANESNPNHKPDDPTKIHWGKFTLMGRMITMLQGLQDKIRASGLYEFQERKWIREMLQAEVMDPNTIQSRVYAPPDDADPIIFPLAQGPDSPHATRSEGRIKRRFPPIFGY